MKYFNSTPHAINLLAADGQEIVVQPNRLISAKAVEVEVPSPVPGLTLVETRFEGTPEGYAVIDAVIASNTAPTDGVMIIIGSIIAAQAYPGLVYAMVPAPGFERVPPAEKKMRADKFTVFPA